MQLLRQRRAVSDKQEKIDNVNLNYMNDLEENEIDPKIVNRKDSQALLLIFIMIIGGIIFLKYTTISGSRSSLYSLFVASFLIQSIFVGIVFLIKIIKHKMQKDSNKKLNLKLTIGNSVFTGFVIWIVMVLLVVLDRFILA